jgi:hypothetical protein
VTQPEPGYVTSAELYREIAQLRDQFTARIELQDKERKLLLDALNGARDAVDARSAAAARALHDQIAALQELQEAKISAAIQRGRDLKELLDERHHAQQVAMQAALVSAKEAVYAAMEAAKEAVAKAETASNKRFDGQNEFRQQLTDQAASFATRTETGIRFDAASADVDRLNQRLSDLELRLTSRLDLGAGAKTGAAETRTEHRLDTGTVISAVVMVLLVISLVITLVLHK